MAHSSRRTRSASMLVAAVLLCVIGLDAHAQAAAQSRNLAPGFDGLRATARILIMPIDIELFSVSGGGLLEPKADWTDAAARHFKTALIAKKRSLGVASVELSEREADEHAETNALHAAIARAIAMHHFGPGMFHLPTKDGKLDWSMGDAVRGIKEKTGADYALFSWIRDSYASGERIAAMIALAMFGVVVHPGGMQVGYASLVELETGRIVWFNRLMRGHGDLREPQKAAETLNALLAGFPSVR